MQMRAAKTVKQHKDEMQAAHWSRLSKREQTPFILIWTLCVCQCERLTFAALNVHSEPFPVCSVIF